MTRLTFHGAAETVTGSKYLLEAGAAHVLIDAGLFQGLKELRQRNWEPLPFPPARLASVVLTHAHIDHIGYLPRLIKDGFAGPVYCTPATEELAELLLLDAAKNQENDAAYANRKGFARHQPALPLFDARDVKRALRRFRTVQRGEWFAVAEPIWARFHDTGHLLGASMIEMEVRRAGAPLRLLFSGDVGRYDAPLYHDPASPPACDYLVCESTYGDRDHPKVGLLDHVSDIVHAAMDRGGVMVVPSFAVGRAQQLIYLLQILIEQKRIPRLPVFLDSPMAVSGMNIYRYYAEEHDLIEALASGKEYAFDHRYIKLARTPAESKQINSVKGPAVIIASSGMMVGGRILHHLQQRLPDARNTIVLAGYMAEGTRGRLIQDGAKLIRMHGREVPVRAAVVEMSVLSGHADRGELMRWLEPLAPPRTTFVTHGELHSATAFAARLRDQRGWRAVVPKMGEAFELEEAS